MTTRSLALSEDMDCPLCLSEGKLKRTEVLDRLGVRDFARVAQLSAEEAFRLLQQTHAHDHHDAWTRFETELDIVHRRRDNRWRLIEVKSTTDLKEYHLDDVAIQHRVVSRSGWTWVRAMRPYGEVGSFGHIDVRRFFKIRNLTRRIERLLPKLTFLLRSEFRAALRLGWHLIDG